MQFPHVEEEEEQETEEEKERRKRERSKDLRIRKKHLYLHLSCDTVDKNNKKLMQLMFFSWRKTKKKIEVFQDYTKLCLYIYRFSHKTWV